MTEVLEQLTSTEIIERINRYERIIFNAHRPGTRIAYQDARDRLYKRLLERFEEKLSDGAFSVFFSLENATITINL